MSIRPSSHMKLRSYLLLGLSIVLTGQAKTVPPAPAPLKIVEVRGEQVPVYATLEGLGTPKTVMPEYPRDAKGQRVSGSALIGVLVDEKGNPLEVGVMESQPIPACGVNACAAVKKWRFPKVQREGKPTKYMVTVPVVFQAES